MSDPLERPCVFFALSREAQGFLRQCPARKRPEVVQTGVGPEKMRAALEERWRRSPPLTLCVSAGFAGALQPDVRLGAVLLASEVVDSHNHVWTVPWPRNPPLSSTVFQGRLLTMPRLVGDPAEKQKLGRTFAARAVDMESATLAEFCAPKGIPFGCVRVISDEMQTPLSPRLVSLLFGPEISWWRFLTAVLCSPKLLSECWRLAKHTRRTSDRLGQMLHTLLSPS